MKTPDGLKVRKLLSVKYAFVDYEQLDRQKRLDDAFDVIFDEIEIDDTERINNKYEYEQRAFIKR